MVDASLGMNAPASEHHQCPGDVQTGPQALVPLYGPRRPQPHAVVEGGADPSCAFRIWKPSAARRHADGVAPAAEPQGFGSLKS